MNMQKEKAWSERDLTAFAFSRYLDTGSIKRIG
jgi:hypothetical protein